MTITPIHDAVERNIVTATEEMNRLNESVNVPATGQSAGMPDKPLTLTEPSLFVKASSVFILFYPWAVLSILLYNIFIYTRYSRKLRHCHVSARHTECKALAELYAGRRVPRLRRNSFASTPMLIGFLRPVIILPDREYTNTELTNIFIHELSHLRRCDIVIKWLSVLACALHWFNPVVWLTRREIDRACELSCDEAVIHGLGAYEKQDYGNTLISVASDSKTPRSVLSTTMCEEKKALKERLVAIMKSKRHTKSAIIISTVVLLAAVCAACALGASSSASQIGTANEKTVETPVEMSAETPVETPAETPAETPIDMPVETQASTLAETQPVFNFSTFNYVTEMLGISVELPDCVDDAVNGDDIFGIELNYVERNERGGTGMTIYHKATREAGKFTGDVLYIERWLGIWSNENPPVYSGSMEVVGQSDKYTYMLRTDGGMEFDADDPETAAIYMWLYNQRDVIGKSVKIVNQEASVPNAGYQTEAEFLSENAQFRETAYSAAEAVLKADADKLSNYLIDPSQAGAMTQGLTDVYNDLLLLEFRFVLSDIISDNEIHTSYEYTAGGNIYNHVSMICKKQGGEWKVDHIGIE
jgi:beta-lactamase regulating signal transducer with metallopeptidase domain